jgi:hypothetical protein
VSSHEKEEAAAAAATAVLSGGDDADGAISVTRQLRFLGRRSLG